MCVRANLALDDEEEFQEDNIDDLVGDEDAPPRNVLREGQQRRANLIELYFHN